MSVEVADVLAAVGQDEAVGAVDCIDDVLVVDSVDGVVE